MLRIWAEERRKSAVLLASPRREEEESSYDNSDHRTRVAYDTYGVFIGCVTNIRVKKRKPRGAVYLVESNLHNRAIGTAKDPVVAERTNRRHKLRYFTAGYWN